MIIFEAVHRNRHRELIANLGDVNLSMDHANSAGAPPRPGGMVEFRFPGGEVIQRETFTCRHCGRAQWIPPGHVLADVAKCFCCWGLVCHECEPLGDCKEKGEFMQQIEASERRHRLFAQLDGG